MTQNHQLGPVRQVVFQATPFCNIDCSYCYLPNRNDTRRMTQDIIAATFRQIMAAQLPASKLEVRWHAGEPLIVGQEFYRSACSLIKLIAQDSISIEHTLQTNGILIDKSWCDVFRELPIRVGVSIDGPEFIHNARRVTRNGAGTFSEVMKGIAWLRTYSIPFDVIAVVTLDTMKHADEVLEFFALLGMRSLGINVEESEGVHVSSSFQDERYPQAYKSFLVKLLSWEQHTGIAVREFMKMRNRIFTSTALNVQVSPFGIITVDVSGNIHTFSPELAGLQHPSWASFSLGNVLSDSIESIVKTKSFHALFDSIQEGVGKCQDSCQYFTLCGGGSPVNKLFENGTFVSTETIYCRSNIQAVADVVITQIEEKPRH